MNSLIPLHLIQKILVNESSFFNYVDDETSRRMWWGALEVIQKEFLIHHFHNGGLWVAAPLPALNDKRYLKKFNGWLWAPE